MLYYESMFSLFGKDHREVVAIFDIGNGSVGGAFVRFSPDELPTLLYSHREPIEISLHSDSRRLTSHMLKLLKIVAHNLQKEGMESLQPTEGAVHVHRAHCIFSSPWFISQTKTVTMEKEAVFAITTEIMNDLVKKESDGFQASLSSGKYYTPCLMATKLLILLVKLLGSYRLCFLSASFQKK